MFIKLLKSGLAACFRPLRLVGQCVCVMADTIGGSASHAEASVADSAPAASSASASPVATPSEPSSASASSVEGRSDLLEKIKALQDAQKALKDQKKKCGKSIVTRRYSHRDDRTTRRRSRAPNQGPLLQALLDPLNRCGGASFREACFCSKSGTRFRAAPLGRSRRGVCPMVTAIEDLPSRLCFIGPPAWTGLRVWSCVADIGPPVSSGFPCLQALASGVGRPPRSI